MPPFPNAIRGLGAVVAAAPGTRVLDRISDAGGTYVIASPVIAWIVRGDGSPTPVTARGPDDGLLSRDYVVEFADGSIIAPDIGTWPDRATWETAMDQFALPLDFGPTFADTISEGRAAA